MTTTLPTRTTAAWELAQRSSIRAFRAGRYVLIVAEGHLPTPGYELDIQQSPLRIFPQQYNLVRRELPGIWPDVLMPYRYPEVVVFPADRPAVTVHHADGQDEVHIEECGESLAPFAAAVADADGEAGSPAPEATGMSPRLSFDEAFADALSKLPQPAETHPDRMTTVDVIHIGGLFGGVAGFHHLVVRIRGTSD
ncbi:hypothetical protein [Blastococcus deserti]|uniref:Uncharacterized protein n=1 Tax=Blastococcus deserti TaxID=2259033 RepID=A0ABW4XFL4_9ACTN